MTAVPKYKSSLKLHRGGSLTSRAHFAHLGETEASWEETSVCTGRESRDRGPGHLVRSTGNNIGKDHFPAGIGDNLQGPGGIGTTEAAGRDLVWRMSSYERGRGSNVPRGGQRATTVRARTRRRAKELWDWTVMISEQALGSEPGYTCVSLDHGESAVKVRSGTVYASQRLSFSGCDEGPWRIVQPPNRTRGIRPSGMTTGAPGTVTLGGVVGRWESIREAGPLLCPRTWPCSCVPYTPVGARARALPKPRRRIFHLFRTLISSGR
jgi:hypothetical protein